MRRVEFLAAAAFLASWTSVCQAQVEATVSGQVVDETDGAQLAGAGVTVLDAACAPLTGASPTPKDASLLSALRLASTGSAPAMVAMRSVRQTSLSGS